MVFTIDSIYKAGVARGEHYQSSITSLTTATTSSLVVSPTTSPNMAVLVRKIVLRDDAFVASGGVGILDIEYPSINGTTSKKINLTTNDELGIIADEVITLDSVNYYIFKPQPPILLKASSTVNSLTVGLPTGATVTSGELKMSASGWQLKEEDYD